MTSDDQHILDVLSDYSTDIRKFTGSVFDTTDRHFAWVASYIKKSVPERWLPEHARPAPPPPSYPLDSTYIERLQDWVSRNRALSAAIVAFVTTGGLLLWRESRKQNRKRRAKRASNGARKEVVVIAGPPNSPMVKSLSHDLERRGFIVYIVCGDIEEEQQVQGESRADVRPLHLDIADVLGTQEAMDRFNNLLNRPHSAFAGAPGRNLEFRGLVLVPDLIYPSGPIETVSPELWSDALNAKVLNTIAVTQAFLPTICGFKARVLVLTPSIVSSLRPPFHGVETAVVAALEGFTASLRAELATLGLRVCHLKLGALDTSSVAGRQQLQPLAPQTESWAPTARQSYASNYASQNRVALSRGLVQHATGSGSGGSSLREVHVAVFDALTQSRPRRVWHVGRGSVAYDMVGKWVPSGLVAWMLGVRRVKFEQQQQQQQPGQQKSGDDPMAEDNAPASSSSWEKVEPVVC